MKLIELKNIITDDFEIIIPNVGLLESYSSFYCGEGEYDRIFNTHGDKEVKKIKSHYDSYDVTILLKD